jgi:lipoprotein signal peptidase
MRIVFWVAFWVFLLDQATKYLVVHLLDLRTLGRIDVWPPFLNLRMAWNTGINFGLLSNDSAGPLPISSTCRVAGSTTRSRSTSRTRRSLPGRSRWCCCRRGKSPRDLRAGMR